MRNVGELKRSEIVLQLVQKFKVTSVNAEVFFSRHVFRLKKKGFGTIDRYLNETKED